MADADRLARDAAAGAPAEVLARLGLAARAFVYLVIGWLAIQIALGHRAQEANQKGALAEVARHPYGLVLLWILGVGFAAYALWRLGEAAFGTAAEGKEAGPRLQSLVRGVVYAVLSGSTFAFIAGHSRQSQARQQETATAELLRHTYGQWLVGIAALIVVGVGLFMVWEGITKRFARQLRMDELHGAARTFVVGIGVVGTVSRGAVFASAGAFALDAALTVDPAKSTGLDGALRTLANRAYGPWLLGVLAAGLILFGVYGFAAARWAKTRISAGR